MLNENKFVYWQMANYSSQMIMIPSNRKGLVCAWYCTLCFTCNIAFNSHNYVRNTIMVPNLWIKRLRFENFRPMSYSKICVHNHYCFSGHRSLGLHVKSRMVSHKGLLYNQLWMICNKDKWYWHISFLYMSP